MLTPMLGSFLTSPPCLARLGDKIGRKTAYGVTLVTMVIFGVGQAMSFGTTPVAVVTTLCICRFLLGVGIGGDYPLSAVIMSEYANK